MVEIKFFGRGGQGAVTAANLIVQAAFKEGKFGLAFPSFGAERRGAILNAFARIDNKEVNIHQNIYNPDIVVVLDKKIIQMTNIFEGIKKQGIVIINTDGLPEKIQEFLQTIDFEGKIFVVNATKICVDLNLVISGWPVVNTAILGALSKASGIVKIDSLIDTIKENWPGSIGERNALACKRAYEETQELFFKDSSLKKEVV
ncbi:MAG: 2-oxoacid:acceptor oxidoreductase family protein [bacterium]